MSLLRPVCALSPPAAQRRGLIWVIGAFAICPCHLPVTLALAAAVLSGTASGAFVAGHPYLAGALISVVWLAATWRGFRYLRSAERLR